MKVTVTIQGPAKIVNLDWYVVTTIVQKMGDLIQMMIVVMVSQKIRIDKLQRNIAIHLLFQIPQTLSHVGVAMKKPQAT